MAIPATPHYRPDIDGLRAIAVVAVITYHLGWLPHGYLGVDVFFVISGYLITGICLREAQTGTFSLAGFWARRVRRILPLVCVVVTATLAIGSMTMLPDDLENLAQSVIATNLFANNVLQAITTRDYWDVVNEYKPLMHTWSLGVEEQYYLAYPLLVLLLVKRRFRSFKWLLTALALASLCMFLADPSEYQRFYFFQYRFFELASGGLLAVSITPRRSGLRGGLVWLVALLALLSANLSISSPLRLVLVLATTLCLLASDGARHRWHVAALTTPVCVFIGLTSFSLYMWHQVLLAFTRYCLVPDITIGVAGCVIATCVLLSYVTWRYIERPFRNPRTISTATVLVFVCLMTAVSSAFAAVIYLRAGVLRDVPELDVRTDNIRRGMHSAYNHRVHASDAPFQETDKVKILVIGNSFARDWANVLLESHCRDSIVVSYAPRIDQEAIDRASKASLVYVHTGPEGMAALPLPMDRVWFIGTKSFGTSNGIAYNARGSDSYCSMRVRPERRVVDENEEMRLVAGDRYVDLLSRVTDSAGEVPVFTPTCKFISQDTRHLTRAGAEYFAGLMAPEINEHLSRAARGTR